VLSLYRSHVSCEFYPEESIRILFASTIFISAFLLFSVEPLVARRILPWFGGSAAVWSNCLVFYQTALLAGYLYARLLTRFLTPYAQSVVHIAVLIISLLLLPVGPGLIWQPVAPERPQWLIWRMLLASIGLLFIALSATSPLLQAWLARSGFQTPYRMFAVSNFASLAALLAYPILIEPILGTHAQSVAWSLLYVVFALLCVAVAWRSRHAVVSSHEKSPPGVPRLRIVQWFALAACGSMLLLSVTNHIDENVAAVPFMWVLPLAVYLLSFVFSFGSLNIYRRSPWLRLLAFSLGILGYAIYNISSVIALQVSLPIFLGGLFVCCLFCHGELNRLRPPVAELTHFYLVLAGGGAVGAMLVGVLAPTIFNGIYELPLTLVFTALLAFLSTWNERVWAARVLWAGVTACMVIVAIMNVQAYHENSISLRRSFYGSLRVVQTPHAGPDEQRILFHGTIEHGSQFLLPPRRSRPTTYYGPDSGVGILLRECFNGPKRVAVIGLGAGTLAAYGRAGDQFVFYEINSQIVDLARALFLYLRETPAQTRITIGDGRLSLARDTSPPFNVIVLDAFSGDAIPVHLLTREAIALYLRHLLNGGVLAFHVSNDFLDLAAVVQKLARDAGYTAILAHNKSDDEEAVLPSDWVLVTNNHFVLDNASIRIHEKPIEQHPEWRLWTDDYNNVWETFKTPTISQ
jgi:hypothetical protein